MKSWLTCLASMLCVSIALAEPPEPPPNELQQSAATLVNDQLVTPLTRVGKKRSKFSRAAPVPVQRRVRVLDTTAQTDARGKHFVRFAIDLRDGWHDDEADAWQRDAMLGCVYVEDAAVFVQRADAYITAKSALGANGKPQSDVCVAAPAS